MKRIKYSGINLLNKTKDLYLENTDERNQRTQIDGEIYHVHGLEESI